MLAVEVGFFVVRLVGGKLMAANESAFKQQVHRVVECRSANPIVFGLHAGVERLDVEVSVLGVDFAQNSIAFRSLALPSIDEVAGENVTYVVELCFRHGVVGPKGKGRFSPRTLQPMKRVILLIIGLSAAGAVFGQSKSEVQRFQKAMELLRSSPPQVEKARAALEKLTASNPAYAAAWVGLGEAYSAFAPFDAAKARHAFVRGAAAGAERQSMFRWMHNAMNQGWYAHADSAASAYLDLPKTPGAQRVEAEKIRASARFAQSAVLRPENYAFRRLSDSVNRLDMNYFPSISGDNATLYFTARQRSEQSDEVILASQRTSVEWGAAQPLPGSLNTRGNEGAVSIRGDQRVMAFAACERGDGYGSCDIYFSIRRADGTWSEAQNAGPAINTTQWESQPCLSADGRELFFVRESRQGQGNANIWRAELREGRWVDVRPLPATINTPGMESTPFLHADGRSLYFASDGHLGLGGTDLYLSRRLNDTAWSVPQHLAYPLNDHLDNFGLVVRPDGSEAFLARGGMYEGAERVDLYQLSLPKAYQPTPILWWTVWVADRTTGRPVPQSEWSISDPERSATVAHRGPNYQVALPLGSPRGFQIQAPGYQLLSERKVLGERSSDARTDTLWLDPIKSGQRTRLENVYFATDSDVLLPESRPELQSLAAWLKANPSVRVQIQGHTDNQGSAAYNLDLSRRRAEGVYRELTLQGIESNRLEFKGFGMTKPVDSNDSEQGRARNRRTEILIL